MKKNGSRFETSRFRLRPCTMDDVDDLHRLWTDPQVRRFLWDDLVITRDQAASAVRDSIGCFEEHGFGYWVLLFREAESPSPVGFCGLRFFGEPPREVELLYGIAPQHWGRGLATEAAEAVLNFGFEECGLEIVYAGADPPNEASFRVMEKLGMSFDRRTIMEGRGEIYYVISREAFAALRGLGSPETRNPEHGR